MLCALAFYCTNGKRTRPKLKRMNTLKIKKNQFAETEYQTDQYQFDLFKSLLNRVGVLENDYSMVTVICPPRLKDYDSQKIHLMNFLKKIDKPYCACMEWSSERSKGNHLHIVLAKEYTELQIFSNKYCHVSDEKAFYNLERCLKYVCKERKNIVVKEKEYFTNIEARSLVPIAILKADETQIPDVAFICPQVKVVVGVQSLKPKFRKFFFSGIEIFKQFFSTLFIVKRKVKVIGNQQNNLFKTRGYGSSE